jgi:CheY-like chemotaxis protein
VTRDRLAVLVVDDYPDSADSLCLLLRLWGHDVRAATSGAQALGLVRGWEPDVALLDLAMPVMDGFELAARVVRACHRPPLLVAVTGLGRPADVMRSRAAGFAHHLVKPVDPDRLCAILREHAPRRSAG